MSTSPLQSIISCCDPEQVQWIRDRIRPDPSWRATEDREERHRRFYKEQWALLEAAQDPKDSSVPDWFRHRMEEAAQLARRHEIERTS